MTIFFRKPNIENIIWNNGACLSKVNKARLVNLIRKAASKRNLRKLEEANHLAEEIAAQVDREFARLTGFTVIKGHTYRVQKIRSLEATK